MLFRLLAILLLATSLTGCFGESHEKILDEYAVEIRGYADALQRAIDSKSLQGIDSAIQSANAGVTALADRMDKVGPVPEAKKEAYSKLVAETVKKELGGVFKKNDQLKSSPLVAFKAISPVIGDHVLGSLYAQGTIAQKAEIAINREICNAMAESAASGSEVTYVSEDAGMDELLAHTQGLLDQAQKDTTGRVNFLRDCCDTGLVDQTAYCDVAAIRAGKDPIYTYK